MATSKAAPGKRADGKRQSSSKTAASVDLAGGDEPAEAQKSKKSVKRAKPPKPPYTIFKRLENRQKAVEQSRRAVFAHLDKITQENIKLAQNGNSAIAKFLFDFAGINQLPAPTEASSKAAKSASAGEAKDDNDPTKAVLSFYKKLGITPPKLKPPKPVEDVEVVAEASSVALP